MEIKAGEGVPDFVLMEHLTEDATFQNIKIRFNKDIIYVSSTGLISRLLSIVW
jgi:hypothetical protein